jgi:hypothetical protein
MRTQGRETADAFNSAEVAAADHVLTRALDKFHFQSASYESQTMQATGKPGIGIATSRSRQAAW